MSIADKITSITGHLEDDYKALETLGVSVEDRNIENIKDMANQIYAKFPKTDYEEGSNITLSNTLKGKLDFDNGVVGIGQTEQDTTQGYNLIDINSGTASTLVGVASSISGDIVTLNGSRNDGSTSNAVRIINEINRFNITTSDTYKMSLNVISGTYTGRVGLTFLNSSGTTLAYIETATNGTTANKSLTFSEQVSKISFFFNGEFSATNFKFQIMLQKGTSDINYEKYTGGQASPNPSYPQDIEVVRGRNRWNREYTRAYIDTDGSIVSSTNTLLTDYIDLNDNITISAKNDMFIVGVAYYNSSKTFISREQKTDRNFKNITYSAPSNTNYIRVYVNLAITNFTDEDVENFKIQIEQGTQATPYLPYNTIEEVVSGINIIGLDTNQYKVDLKAGDKITFKNEGTQALTLNLYTNYGDTTRNDFWSVGVNATRIITVAHDTKAIAWEVAPDGLAWGNYGDTLSTYEPYITPTSYQLSLGDIELNAIGDYKDELIYDVDEDKVYKNETIGEYLLTGQETINRGTPNNRFELDNLVDILHLQARQQTYCNRYKYVSSGSADYGMFAYWNGAITQVFIYDKDYTQSSDLQSYFANNETYFCYIRNTPILKEIMDTTLKAQVKALYNSHSNNGTTIITSNGNLPMIIKIRGLKGE